MHNDSEVRLADESITLPVSIDSDGPCLELLFVVTAIPRIPDGHPEISQRGETEQRGYRNGFLAGRSYYLPIASSILQAMLGKGREEWDFTQVCLTLGNPSEIEREAGKLVFVKDIEPRHMRALVRRMPQHLPNGVWIKAEVLYAVADPTNARFIKMPLVQYLDGLND